MSPQPTEPAAPEPAPRSAAFYFDTVTLSNFALVGRMDLLLRRYGQRAFVTPEVLSEVLDGITAGYDSLQDVETATDDRRFTTAPSLTVDEKAVYMELLRSLAPGEASCIARACVKGGTVVTDDRATRSLCSERDVPFTGTVGILKACVQEGLLEGGDADAVLQSMIDHGYYAPVRRISDLI